MSLDSDIHPRLKSFLEDKRRYREYARGLPLNERLRDLEELQEQSYEILRIRELNGGKPIPAEWRSWAAAQREIGLKK